MDGVGKTAQLDALYAQLPKLECQGKCQDSCAGIMMTYVEWQRIRLELGWTPANVKRLTDPCPMLHRRTGQCRVYSVRPMICRLWGVVEEMRCPWGCEPERFLSREEGYEFLRQAQTIGTPERLIKEED